MKAILLITILLVTCCEKCKTQNLNLYLDSIFFSKYEGDLALFAKKQSRLQLDYFEFVDKSFELTESKSIRLRRYAYIFDYLVSKNIYLNERFPREKVVKKHLKAYIIENVSKDTLIKSDSDRKMPFRNESGEILSIYFFKIFCSFRLKYKEDFDLSDLQSHEIEIDNIIKYGNFQFPITVKKILLNKYDHIKENKYYDDMRYYWTK